MLTVHLRIADSQTQRPTAVRLQISDDSGRRYFPLGRWPTFATGIGEDVGGHVKLGSDLFAVIDGSCEIRLPAGVPLRVQAFKGPEYEPLHRTVTLGTGQMALRFEMNRWSSMASRGWISGDARVHELSPHSALLEASAEDVQVVQLLVRERMSLAQDGNSYPTHTNMTAFSGQKPTLEADGRAVVVNTLNSHPVLGSLALLHSHRAVFPLAFGAPDHTDDWSLADWCNQCHRKKGLVVWVNAFRPDRGVQGGEALVAALLGKIDAIEVDAQHRSTPFLPWVYHLWNAGFLVPLVGASGKESNRTVLGGMRTYARRQGEADSQPLHVAWIEAVRAGQTSVTNGPLLETHFADGRIQSQAESVIPFDQLELIANGQVVDAVPAKVESGRWRANLDVVGSTQAGWLACRVVGGKGVSLQPDSPVLAHTSPIALASPWFDSAAIAVLRRGLDATREWALERANYGEAKWQKQLIERCEEAARELNRRVSVDPGP
jgi:hypothetical protein